MYMHLRNYHHLNFQKQTLKVQKLFLTRYPNILCFLNKILINLTELLANLPVPKVKTSGTTTSIINIFVAKDICS